ncbi:MAG TPA: translation initiation factor IF-2 [Acidimicrobiales bacterium]|nr:translation initiation factor IF-2 [Acidimicrobiales bacterium]
MGGRAAPAGPARTGGMGGPRPSGPGGPPRTGAPRTGGFPPRTGGPGGSPGGGFGARPGGGGGPGGGPGGGFGGRPGGGPGGGFGGRPGGPGGRGRPPRRKGGRRRRPLEELEPFDPSKGYAPSSQPVPTGEIIVERGSTAQDLGPKLNRSAGDIVRFLFLQGDMTTATSPLSDEAIELFADEVGASIRLVEPGEEKEAALQRKYFDDDEEEEDESLLRPRPPIITVMGHVDHGKTKLLDRIRETNVVEGEAGGITQHIGAYQVEKDGRLLTFIDTPGHEAFTAMRARGANVTDIVILVVAADDGVMPQTVEALNHAKAADVPIVVAVNKIDREEADPTRVMQQLSELGLTPEQWGGDTIMVELSALQNLGVDDLLEQLLLVAEVQLPEQLVANPEAKARGAVLEANLDPGRGPVATVMVETGTLRVGDAIVAGAAWGRVRAMLDDKGDKIKEAPPSTPVQVLGFSDVPSAGDDFRVTATDKVARDIAEQREQRFRSADLRKTPSMAGTTAKLEDIFEQIQRGETATLNLILKADVQGSLEAVTESLRKRERDEVKLSFVHRAVGGITENDIQLAAASSATIIGFNVRPDRKARALAEAEDVDVRTYEIIYKLIEDIEAAMIGMLKPEYEEVVTGDAEVREVYSVPRVGKVAGCYVLNGVITRGSKVRFLREGTVIWNGTVTSLKRFKDDVREVQTGFECGIGLSDFQDLRSGDVIETYEEREIPRT